MKHLTEYVATTTHDDVTIMAYFTKGCKHDCWEVYYRKPDFPFMFAFGLPDGYLSEEVMDIAVKNIWQYQWMFDE